MKFKILLNLALIFFLFVGCEKKDEEATQTAQNEQNKQTQISNQEQESTLSANYNAPFSLTFTNGQILNMQKNKKGFSIENGGKPTLFAFFASWCDACLIQTNVLNAVTEKYGDKIDIIGILIGDEIDLDGIKEYEKFIKAKYKIAYGEANDFFANTLGGITEIPYMVIYDKKGEFSTQYFGLIPEEILTLELEKIF